MVGLLNDLNAILRRSHKTFLLSFLSLTHSHLQMATFFLPLSASVSPYHSHCKSLLLNRYPNLSPKFSSITQHFPISIPVNTSHRRKTTAPPSGLRDNSSSSPKGVDGSSQFMNENGVVEDMDGYLNYLSLEYDSVWDTKPSWCQPWTIAVTGILVIACSWLVLHSPIATTIVATLISAWWYIFLYSYPKMYSDMIAERRRKVTGGLEDTYGESKSP